MHRKIENFDGASSTKTYIFFFQKKKNEKRKMELKNLATLNESTVAKMDLEYIWED